jgi:hypothetical protein
VNDELIAKTKADGSESLWMDCSVQVAPSWSVATHRPGADYLAVTVGAKDDRQLTTYWQRELVRKLLPYLQRFADGGDLGVPAVIAEDRAAPAEGGQARG